MTMNSINSEFQQILLAAKERRGDLSVDTMIVSSHLAQMRTFMLRRGIEFYAEQDSFGKRREFLHKLCEENMLEMKFESIVDYFLCDGQGLFYFRPVTCLDIAASSYRWNCSRTSNCRSRSCPVDHVYSLRRYPQHR